MKKSLKRVITTILAVATVGSTAVLFAGCGEKSDEEKVMDALNDLASGAMNDINSFSGKQSSVKKEKVDVNFFKAIDENKAYTVKKNDLADEYYLELDQEIEADGFTFTKTKDEPAQSEYERYVSVWDVTKDGKKAATVYINADVSWVEANKADCFTIYAGSTQVAPEADSEYEIHLDWTYDQNEVQNIHRIPIESPKRLTLEESKQNVAKIKEYLNKAYPITNGHMSITTYKEYDVSNAALKNIYYIPEETRGGYTTPEQIFAVYSGVVEGDILYGDGALFGITMPYVFLENGEIKMGEEPTFSEGRTMTELRGFGEEDKGTVIA